MADLGTAFIVSRDTTGTVESNMFWSDPDTFAHFYRDFGSGFLVGPLTSVTSSETGTTGNRKVWINGAWVNLN